MKKRLITAMLLILAVSLLGGGAVIWAKPTAAVNNMFSTGLVDIKIDEYQLNADGKEVKWKDEPLVLPGMQISKIPRIHNHGEDCYIRIKVIFEGTDQLDTDCLYGIGEEWVKAADGYFYLSKVLGSGRNADFFREIRIPNGFDQSEEGKRFILRLQVDAIQSRNFMPDFECPQPWGAVVMTEAVSSGEDCIRLLQTSTEKKFVIEYRGESADLIINEENFFGNLPVLLPGDEFTDGARLINNGDRPIRLYFRSFVEDASDITDRIRLIIETETEEETTVVYEGSLRAESLGEDTLLMTIPSGGVGKMVFSLYVPEELDNNYTLQDKNVQWIFSTEEVKEPEAVDTGDNKKVGGYFMLSGLALGFAVRMIERRRAVNGRKA